MSDTPPNLVDRVEAIEQQGKVWATHHYMLAQQIGELTVGINKLREENVELRQAFTTMEDRIPTLMAQGIAAAVGNPATWEAARAAMHRQAKDATGGIVLRGVRFLVDKLFWGAVAVGALYMMGGWPAVAAIVKLKASE